MSYIIYDVHYIIICEWFWNNWGFNASEELVNFFLQYKLTVIFFGSLSLNFRNNLKRSIFKRFLFPTLSVFPLHLLIYLPF